MTAIFILALIGVIIRLLYGLLSDPFIGLQNEFLTVILIISCWPLSVAWGITFIVLGSLLLIIDIVANLS